MRKTGYLFPKFFIFFHYFLPVSAKRVDYLKFNFAAISKLEGKWPERGK